MNRRKVISVLSVIGILPATKTLAALPPQAEKQDPTLRPIVTLEDPASGTLRHYYDPPAPQRIVRKRHGNRLQAVRRQDDF